MSTIITVTGNITEPVHRRTPAGVPLTSFRIASTARRFDSDKREWIDTGTSWYSVTAWRALGEHAIDSLARGDRVIVTGRLRMREWETDAKKGMTAEIEADALGHDLLWGTTTFRRAEGRGQATNPVAPDAAWGTPASPPAQTAREASAEPQWSAPLIADESRAMDEGANGSESAAHLVDDPTPF